MYATGVAGRLSQPYHCGSCRILAVIVHAVLIDDTDIRVKTDRITQSTT
jgi:hypothetical protein